MIQFFRNGAVSLAVAALLSSCVDTDNTFGNDVLPPEWAMKTTIDSTMRPLTHIISLASVVTVNDYMNRNLRVGVLPVGSLIDPKVGRTSAQVFSHIRPMPSFRKDDKYFGPNAVADSMYMILAFTTAVGDTTSGTEIELYDVEQGDFKYYRTYHTNYNIASQISNTPIAKFTLRSPGYKVLRLPDDYAKKYFSNAQDATNPYSADTLFHEQFKGLYLRTADATTGQGCMYGFNLSSSEVILYYHNDDTDSIAPTVNFRFLDLTTSRTTRYNTAFSMAQHNYSMADEGGVVASQIGNTTIATDRGYIQGLGGLTTTFTIPQSQIDQIRASAIAQGYSSIAVHAAELIVDVDSPMTENYEKSFTNIAPYMSISELLFTHDYYPFDSQFAATIDGVLSRSKGRYTVNITSYMQLRFTGKVTDETIQLAPAMNLISTADRSVIMGSTSTRPPKIVLTYTMIK